MKFKRALAALAAAVMVIGMVSCGEKDTDKDEDEEEETSSVEVVEDSEEAPAEESEAETEESEAETEESTADVAESEAEVVESEADPVESTADDPEAVDGSVKFEGGVLDAGTYTLTVDESKWEYTAGAGVDAQFAYVGDDSDPMYATANFNIVSMSDTIYAELTPEDYAEQINAAYAEMEGATVNDAGKGELNGYETYEVDVTYEIMEDMNMTLKQLILTSDEGTLVVISYGAMDSVMADLQSEFDAAISTFSFT